ncbi:MAG TPA: HAD hydrolase-like protein [Turneriella sp.]|nr:HAD hydrolase-like protein [Turneriella sp.]
MKYRHFALDIDGTVFSSEEIIYPVYKEAIENYCKTHNATLVVPPRERIMLEIGKPVKKIFENLFPALTEGERDKISDSILGLLAAKIKNGGGEYYPDVAHTIETIHQKGGIILVASNGRQPYIDAILDYIGVLQYVTMPTYIDGDKIVTKSDILKTYVDAGFPAKEILMVGDRLSDYDAARAIDCDFAWCAYGHAPQGEIADYTVRLEKFTDLIQYV